MQHTTHGNTPQAITHFPQLFPDDLQTPRLFRVFPRGWAPPCLPPTWSQRGSRLVPAFSRNDACRSAGRRSFTSLHIASVPVRRLIAAAVPRRRAVGYHPAHRPPTTTTDGPAFRRAPSTDVGRPTDKQESTKH